MAEIINLRRVRKQIIRKQDELKAEANRLKFGQSKADKRTHAAETQRIETAFEGHKRET